MDKATLERLRQFAGAISRATNGLIIRKAQDIQKHTPGGQEHDQSTHGVRGAGGSRDRGSVAQQVESVTAQTRGERLTLNSLARAIRDNDRTRASGIISRMDSSLRDFGVPKSVHDWLNTDEKAAQPQDLGKHGDHDQSTHNPYGAGAVQARRDRSLENMRGLEVERLSRGEKPNPNLTDTVSTRSSIVGEHRIYETKGPDGQPRYIADYNPSEMFREREGERVLGVHNSLESAQNRVQEHKDSLIAEHNARAREQAREKHDDPEHQPPQHEREGEKAAQTTDLSKYIRHEGDKWTVYSEDGKPMGTYDSESGAKERLRQVEAFKHMKKAVESLQNLIGKKW